MASSEQLEREAEATRARIAATLGELRMRISPGQIADQAIDYARESGGGDFVRHLGRQVADNPLPVALMGAGLAWLMVAQRRDGEAQSKKGDGSVDTTEPGSSNDWDRTVAMASEFEKTSRRAVKKAQTTVDQAAEKGSQAYASGSEMAKGAYEVGSNTAADAAAKSTGVAARAYDKAAEVADSAYARASEVAGRARETTADVYDRARDAAGRVTSSASQGTRGLTKFMREEPLVVAGLGIAIGALIGALLPATEVENRTMGEASNRLKRDAREAAREQWERGKDIAEDGWDEAKGAARRTWEDAKTEAQTAWEDTKRGASQGGRSDGHAADTTGAQASLVPSEEEVKAAREMRSNS